MEAAKSPSRKKQKRVGRTVLMPQEVTGTGLRGEGSSWSPSEIAGG